MSSTSLVGKVTETQQVKDFFDCSFLCLERGPFVCLSFNLDKADDNGYYTCELSSSERYLEPQRIQQPSSYDYYGTTTESLFSLLPCSSSPCNYGGSCIHGPGLGEFSCQCGVEITVLPFIDHLCNVDSQTSGLHLGTLVEGLFHVKVGRYKLNYYDAKRVCEIHGATLATYNQLHAAWSAGLEHCAFGWLIDSTARYPMQSIRSGCCGTIGICGSSTPLAKTNTYNAWCYKE